MSDPIVALEDCDRAWLRSHGWRDPLEPDPKYGAYRIEVGMNYPDCNGSDRRVEIGEIVTDLPEKNLRSLIADGSVTPLWMLDLPPEKRELLRTGYLQQRFS